MSSALENISISELIAIDNTYLDRMNLRRSTMDEHPDATLQCNTVAEPAVLELYDWLVSTYLPQRFPMIYHPTDTAGQPQLFNSASDSYMPIRPSSPLSALRILGENIDTDFLILLPSSTNPMDGSPIYHLQAFVTCFPAGFSTREKCGKPLAAIHGPVPGYAAKLEKSMDRFFAKIEVGRVVRRTNWSVTTNDKLFSDGGIHLYGDAKQEKPVENAKTVNGGDSELDEQIAQQRKEVVVDDCRLRCERQTLHRLPRTNALVFAFKTYLYRLDEVKEEGLGPVLAEAIEGLGTGSVPEIMLYKRGVIWGEKVREYLLS